MNPTIVDEAHRLLDGIEPTCEHRSASGEMTCCTEASWLLRVSCGHSAFFCESHRATMSADLGQRGQALRCAGHGGKRVLYDWVAV